MSQATEETEIPLQEVHCPCLYSKIPFIPELNKAPSTASMLPFYSSEDDAVWPESS